jgi:hypothetical protein
MLDSRNVPQTFTIVFVQQVESTVKISSSDRQLNIMNQVYLAI